MRTIRYSVLCSSLFMMGVEIPCRGLGLASFECQDRTYDVTAQFVEQGRFEFDGEMIFSYDQDATFGGESVYSHADLKYDFTTEQTATAGRSRISI